jgi:hypothetical protein
MGLDWPTSLELIRRSVALAKAEGGQLIASGAGTDHLAPGPNVTVDDVIRAYEEQCGAVEAAGGRIILMASRALTAAAKSSDDYARVYGRILGQVKEPVIIHWLGEMFDPALEGYWGSKDHWKAMDTCVSVIKANAAKVDGIKVSLLDKDKEIAMRRRLPKGVRMYSGDDFNYPELIEGDAEGYSDALLGIFDVIAPAASAALGALARNDKAGYRDIFDPTVPLSRHVFKAPTRFYKTGVVFMAYLNGLQEHFTMVGGPAERAIAAASRRALPARRRRRPVPRSRRGLCPHAPRPRRPRPAELKVSEPPPRMRYAIHATAVLHASDAPPHSSRAIAYGELRPNRPPRRGGQAAKRPGGESNHCRGEQVDEPFRCTSR